MDGPILVSLIGVTGVVAGAAIGHFSQLHIQRLKARREAEAVLARYREPLLSAVVDLQWSLYNMLQDAFLWRLVHRNEGDRAEVALGSTLFNFAQYFGWREVLRLESQLLEFEDFEETRRLNDLLSKITSRFSKPDPPGDESFRLFKAEQRAIGEVMLAEHAGRTVCVGYAAFVSERRDAAGPWLGKLESDLLALAADENPRHDRLRDIQHLMVDLAHALDRRGVRASSALKRA